MVQMDSSYFSTKELVCFLIDHEVEHFKQDISWPSPRVRFCAPFVDIIMAIPTC